MAGRDIDYNYDTDAPRHGDWVYGLVFLGLCLIGGAVLYFAGL